ncbi:hypothetical protein COCOBI_10-0230 [Coccomyxa sp. Obi]|nr:hypothetical protein COCOBI_10-0230 [Coccomyxa sp. Obi]
MGWSDEVHARRLLDIKAYRRKEKAAGKYAVAEVKGNSGNLPIALLLGTVASVVAWQREGRYLRGRDVRRVPLIGGWLADHVPRWRNDSPRRRAGSAAAARQAKAQRSDAAAAFAAVGALQPSAPSQHATKSGTAASSSSNPHADYLPASAQQNTPKKPRSRKRTKKK